MGDLLELPTNTAGWYIVGPFLDKTDGITPELSITVANSAITLTANANAESAPTLVLDSVAGNDGTNTLVHITNDDAGLYYIKLTASNNNRYGSGMLVIEDVDTYVTVFHPVSWVSAAYWNWKYGTTKPEMNLADDAITAAKFDESTAFPLKSADTGSTAVARTGADSDTLEVLSDEIAALQADVGDASASTLGSLYAILGNAAASLTSRTPAALTANGNMKASLMEILATALTETSGYLAAGFKKFFNVATPVMTVESINQGADNNVILSNATYGNAALRTRGDAAWVTATGFSTHSAADVVTAMETNGSKLDHLWEMTEDDGGTRRLTTNALKQALSGSGLDAAGIRGALGMSASNLDTQLAALPTAAENADAVCDEALSGHTTGGTVGAGIAAAGTAGDPWSGAIPGSYVAGQAGYILDQIKDLLTIMYGGIGSTAWTYTVTDTATSLPIQGVEVWVTTDIGGTNKIAYGTTNASGIATLYPDVSAGTTVYVWRSKSGVVFTDPDTEVVSFS